MAASLPLEPDGPLTEPPVSVKAVVLLSDAVLLGENDRGGWELLGGRPEPGESWEQALAREVREEAGLAIEVREQVLDEVFEVVPGRSVRIIAFRADLIGTGAIEPSEEHRRVAFVPLTELVHLRLPDVYRLAIELCR